MLITYCEKCGSRMQFEFSESTEHPRCRACKAEKKSEFRPAADSSQIPYVTAPNDAEILSHINKTVPVRHP